MKRVVTFLGTSMLDVYAVLLAGYAKDGTPLSLLTTSAALYVG